MHSDLPGDMCQYVMPGLQLDPEHGVGQVLADHALNFDPGLLTVLNGLWSRPRTRAARRLGSFGRARLAAASTAPPVRSLRWHSVPFRQYPNRAAGYSYGVLEMRRQLPVRCHHRPVIRQSMHPMSARIDHGLDGQGHALLKQHTLTRPPEVRDLRGLMEGLAHSVPDQIPDHRETMRPNMLIDRGGNIADAIAGHRLVKPLVEGLLCGLQQAVSAV